MSAEWTCNACDVVFGDAVSHRSHYKSDWHRYNLRRRQIELAPIPFQVFRRKKEAVLEKRRLAELQEKAEEASVFRCEVCRKSFASSNSYEQHLRTKKHKKLVAAAESKRKKKRKETSKSGPRCVVAHTLHQNEDDDKDDDGATKNRSIDKNTTVQRQPNLRKEKCLRPFECFFCQKISSDQESHLRHMKSAHDFVIPEPSWVRDMSGLLKYFAEKVGIGQMCLCCQKGFGSIPAVKAHMVDVGHCKIPFEVDFDLEEYLEFYKYGPLDRSSSDAAHAWHAAVAACSSGDATEASRSKFRTIEIDENEELVLSDGRRVGNRKYKHVYKQYYTQLDQRPEAVANRRALLERTVGPSAASAIITSTSQLGRRRNVNRSVALSLFHAHDRRRAQAAAARATDIKRRDYGRRALHTGIQMNKVNVSKIPHRRGVFVSWKT